MRPFLLAIATQKTSQRRGDMATLKIKYDDGTEETIESAFAVIDQGEGEISYFIGAGFTRHHALQVAEHQVIDSEAA